jgi:hypothetical protein
MPPPAAEDQTSRETKPPVRLNREEMEKYRDRLKKYYLNVPIRFR